MDNATLLRDLFITFLPILLYYNILDYERDYKHWCISEGTKTRRSKKRILWSIVNERISDKQFRRMFRMTRQCFYELLAKNSSNRNHILMCFLLIKIQCL